jgi:hypothetical protein
MLGIKPRFLGSEDPVTGPYPELDESKSDTPSLFFKTHLNSFSDLRRRDARAPVIRYYLA